MRRFFLAGIAAIGLMSGATIANAGTLPNVSVDEATHKYWSEAQKLTQKQLTLLDRVEQSAQKPETKRLNILSGQVLLYTSAVDRFLKSNYPDPALLCSPPAELGEVAGTDGASLEQVQVYCSLYQSTHELTAMKTRLDLQAKLMTPGAITDRAATVQLAQVQPQAPTNLPTVTLSKQQVLVLVQSSRQRLAQMQSAFPEALRISIVQPLSTLDQSANSPAR